MDSRGTWPPPSSQQRQPRPGMLRSPNPNPNPNPHRNPNPAAIMIGGGSTFTSQSPPHRLPSSFHRVTYGALSLPNQQHQHNQATPLPQQQQTNQRTLDSPGFGAGSHSQSTRRGIETRLEERKRKPGRPRKYSDDKYGGENSNDGGNANSSDPPAKRGRGRPRGSKRQHPEALGASDGIGFIPHIVNVKTGEDIATKLREFSEQGLRTISILSGSGSVGKVTLSHSSSVTVTYEGQFEIVTLAGSFLNCEVNGRMSRIGSLNVALALNDGRVIGGGVIGELVAATDVQVVVGSFLVEPTKPKERKSSQAEGSSGEANVNNPFASPCSQRSPGPSCDSTGNNESSSHPLQPDNNVSSSNRGTSSGHSAPQQHHQQHRQQQEQQRQQRQQQQRQRQQYHQQQRQHHHQQQRQHQEQQRQQQQEEQQRQQQQQQRQQQQEEEEHRLHIEQSIQMYGLWPPGRGL